ncbi:MAG: HutD family protein [Bacteroidales bacterium]|nr:HutD family protein [Bacteroidales bacterium]
MQIQIIRKSELITSTWSGGTTTQIAIFPENASYADGNFIFRISSAVVDSAESNFTKLPGVSREIMILEGELKLEHKDQYSKILKKFDTDSFKGEWDTKSNGKVIDFNLMTTGNAFGAIEAIHLNENKKITKHLSARFNVMVLFIHKGDLEIINKENKQLLYQGDSILLFNEKSQEEISIHSNSNTEIIISEISY